MTNQPACEAGLRRHGDLTFWLDEAALAGWQAPRRATPGWQPRYSDLAIESALTSRLVFHLALRRAEAFSHSVLRLLRLDLAVPDHTTLSRRGRIFTGRGIVLPGTTGPCTLFRTARACRCSGRASGTRRNTGGPAGNDASFTSQ